MIEELLPSIALGVILLVLLVSSLLVARTRNLVHAVFWLAGVLIATAALMVWLSAPFLAGIQIVLYAGGVITLMLFAVMLTHRDPDVAIPNPAHRPLAAMVASGVLLAILLSAIWSSPELEPTAMQPTHEVTAAQIGLMFLQEQLLAFEVLSVLLLVAMIGAIVLARRSDP